jgi:hypothetical protein
VRANHAILWPGVVALLLFGAMAWYLRSREAEIIQSARAQATEHAPRPPAEIAAALRAAKLVTVEIDTHVSLTRGDDSWRGGVAAHLRVPVRLHYGVDLSSLDATAVGISPLSSRVVVVRVPVPTRIATETFLERENAKVEVGWLRLRSRAGEYYLGKARRDAAQAARNLRLAPEDEARVREASREQIRQVVRRILGPDAAVTVVFEEPG